MSGVLAISGGEPAHTLPAPRYPTFEAGVHDRIRQMLTDGPTQGLSKGHPVVREFEERLAAFHAVPHCLAASSGHGALQSALIGLELTDGAEVLTSPYSWGASVSCILHNGAVPAFVDVSPETGLIDPERLHEGLTSRTEAILVPHLYGQPTDMTAVLAFAERNGLAVIEDGSQAHGARHRGRPIGSFGDAAGFSTNGVKPLATTEGGYMVTRHDEVYWKATLSCQHAGRGELIGRASEPGFPDELRPWIDSLVYTYRPNLATVILALERIDHVDTENAARRRNAERFRDLAREFESIELPDYEPHDDCVFHMVTMNYDERVLGVSRDTFLAALQAEGVNAVAYVEKGLHRSPRLSPEWAGPRVMWTAAIRASGVDPNAVELPGCDAKVARSIELPWNFPHDDAELVASIAGAVRKLERHADELRAHEREGQGSALAGG